MYPQTQTLQTLIKFVGWKSIEFLKPYDRWVTNHFTAINHFQEGDEGEHAMAVVVSLATNKGYLCGDELSEPSVANCHITDEKEMNLIIKGDTTTNVQKWFPLVRRLNPPKQMKEQFRSSNPKLDKAMTKEVHDRSVGAASKNTGIAFSKFWTTMIRDNRYQVEDKFKKDLQYRALVKEKKQEIDSKMKKALYERIRNIEEAYSATNLVEKYYEKNLETLLSSHKQSKAKNKTSVDDTNLSYGNFKLMLNNLKRKRELQIQKVEDKFTKEKEKLKVKFAHIQYESESDSEDSLIELSGEEDE